MNHAARGFQKARFADVVAGFLVHGRRREIRPAMSASLAPWRAKAEQVVVALREGRTADFAVRGKPDAAAMAAERPGKPRAMMPISPRPLVEGEAAGGLGGVIGGQGDKRPELLQSRNNLIHGDDNFRRPRTSVWVGGRFFLSGVTTR